MVTMVVSTLKPERINNSMAKPLVTVYMPTFNRGKQLLIAANSVLSQSYSNLELIIVNDGSSDNTAVVLSKLVESDSRVRVFHHKASQGACVARNTAIKHAKGELITGIDDDDEFIHNRIELLVANLKNNSFVCSGYYWQMPNKTKKLFCSDGAVTLSDMLDINSASNQVLTKTEYLRAIGGFDENLPSFQDYDCWVRLLSKFGDGYRINTPTYIVKVDHDSHRISSDKNKKRLGFTLFYKKHKHLMSPKNIANQVFRKKVTEGEKFSVFYLLCSLRYGLVLYKIGASRKLLKIW